MKLQDNHRLVQALRNGDEKVFHELYACYSAAIFRNIYKLLPQQEDAEDLLQSVFLKLWEARIKLNEEQSIDGWLFTTSFHLTMNRLRVISRSRLQAVSELPADLQDGGAENENHSELYARKISVIHNAVHTLPSRKKQAFKLCKLEGKSYKEAALLLGISEETVKDYVKSAMGILRRQALQTDLLMYGLITLYSATASS